jgi:hypothetical protein
MGKNGSIQNLSRSSWLGRKERRRKVDLQGDVHRNWTETKVQIV